jgi:hypothetical protein
MSWSGIDESEAFYLPDIGHNDGSLGNVIPLIHIILHQAMSDPYNDNRR